MPPMVSLRSAVPLETIFTANDSSLKPTRAINWSVGIERKLPGSIYAGANFLQKRTSNLFRLHQSTGPGALSGLYLLTNARQDHYVSEEFDLSRTFANGYRLFGAYTHSSALTNAALDYMPTVSLLGPQQSAPLPWDVPNRVISWGWLPLLLPRLKRSWDFVYTLDWHTGFPYNAVNANQQVVARPVRCGSLTTSPSAPASNGASTSAALISVCEAFWKMPPPAGTPRS